MFDPKKLQEILERKDSKNRFQQFCGLLNQALSSAEPIFDAGTMDQDCKECWYLMKHSEHLWNDAVHLLRMGSFASSVFMSIATIEEIGKLSVGRFQIVINQVKRTSRHNVPTTGKNKLFCSHRTKHQIAALSGFAINNRADRILGIENIVQLFKLVEGGSLENVRQNSLYSRSRDGIVELPRTNRQKDDAVFFCAATGELLAEIGGFSVQEFERLIQRVDDFHKEFPLNGYKLVLKD